MARMFRASLSTKRLEVGTEQLQVREYFEWDRQPRIMEELIQQKIPDH